MPRISPRVLKIAALALALPLVLVLVLLAASNTDLGRRAIERLSAQLSGGGVTVTGLSGRFPGDLHIDRIELRDRDGVWLTATDIELKSSAASLLFRHLDVERLSAAHVLLARVPVASHAASSDSTGYLRNIDVASLVLPRFEIGAALAGSDAVLDVTGRVHLTGLEEIDTELRAHRTDGPGRYELSGRFDKSHLEVALDLEEPAGGPLQVLAGVPRLGELSAHLKISGPRNAETTRLELSAGALSASAHGSIDWTDGNAEFDAAGQAPAMAPGEWLAWDSIDLDGHFHGKFSSPALSARLKALGVRIGDASFRSLSATMSGAAGSATLAATLEGLSIPGPDPALFAAAPIEVKVAARHTDATWRAEFTGTHPLLALSGQVTGGDRARLDFEARAPSVAPFMRLAGIDLDGRGSLSGALENAKGEQSAKLRGTLESARGSSAIAGLLASTANFALAGTRRGSSLAIDRMTLGGGAVRATASGTDRNGVVDLKWEAEFPRLAALSPALAGTARARGRLEGPTDDYAVSATASLEGSAHAAERGVVELTFNARGLPAHLAATAEARGTLDGAPLRVEAALKPLPGGGVDALIEHAGWRAAVASGQISFPGGGRPIRGAISLQMPNLAEFARIAGAPLTGSAAASIDFKPTSPHGSAEVHAEAREVGISGHRVGHLVVTGTIEAPTTHAIYALNATADGIVAAPLTGSARLDATGPADKLALSLSTRWFQDEVEVAGGTVIATLDLPERRLEVATLEASARGQGARLLAPTTVHFKNGLAFDAIRIGTGQGTLEVAGRLTPVLDVTVSLKNVTPAPLAAFFPDWPIDGTISADAQLTGLIAAPEGTVNLHATGLRLHGQSGRAVPPTEIKGSVVFAAGQAAVDLNLHAGTAAGLAITGSVPMQSEREFALHASGEFALATANPFLEPDGRRIRGQATIEGDLTGTSASPSVAGSVSIEHGDFQDFARGAHLADISVTVVAADRSLRITKLLAHTGAGTVAAEGTIGVLEPTVPVDLKLTAVDAQPFATDLLTARFDGTLIVKGGATTALNASGQLHIARADINIPNALPREVAVLDVRRPHAKPPAPASWELAPINLDIGIDAPRAVFVRGRGLDSELGGDLHVAGTYTSPQVAGGFDMRRGTLSLAGASLKFSSGRVSFNGAGPKKTLDPTLDFLAENVSGDVTATLTVGGYASAPTIELTSSPDMPQDEILSRLLFGIDAKQLGPLQMLGIGVALASISGVGYGGSDPLAAIQKRLGLDRLAVGGSTGTDPNAATVEAGRYVTSRLYVGAVQSTTGITKLQAQIDLTKHLKLQTVVGNSSTTAQGTTPQNDPGNTVGLVYQIDY